MVTSVARPIALGLLGVTLINTPRPSLCTGPLRVRELSMHGERTDQWSKYKGAAG